MSPLEPHHIVYMHIHLPWVILAETKKEKGLNHVQVVEDSKLLVDWANQHHNIDNLNMYHIMSQV